VSPVDPEEVKNESLKSEPILRGEGLVDMTEQLPLMQKFSVHFM
jgi:hypothetical protein